MFKLCHPDKYIKGVKCHCTISRKRRSDTNEEDDLYIIGKWINSIPGKGMAKRETKGHIINNNKPFFSASFACEIEAKLPVTMTTMDDILFVLYSGQVPHNG